MIKNKLGKRSVAFQLGGLGLLVLGLFVSSKVVLQKTALINRAVSTCSTISTDSQAGLITCNNIYGCFTSSYQCIGTSLSQCNHIGCSTLVSPPHYCRIEYSSESACKSTVAVSHGCRPTYYSQSCYGIVSSDNSFCSSFRSSSNSCSSPKTRGRCIWKTPYKECTGQWTTETCQGDYTLCQPLASVACSQNQIRCVDSTASQSCLPNGADWGTVTSCPLGKRCFNVDAYHQTAGCYYP